MTNNQTPGIHAVWIYQARPTDTEEHREHHQGKIIQPYLATAFRPTRNLLHLTPDADRVFTELGRMVINYSSDDPLETSDLMLQARHRTVLTHLGRNLAERTPLDKNLVLLTEEAPERLFSNHTRPLTIDGITGQYHIDTLATGTEVLIRTAYENRRLARIRAAHEEGALTYFGEDEL